MYSLGHYKFICEEVVYPELIKMEKMHNVCFGQSSLPLIFQAVFISQDIAILIEIALVESYC